MEGKGYVLVLLDDFGMPNRMLLLESHIAKKFASYCMAKKDIDLVSDALIQLKKDNNNTIVKQSLTAFSITTYAKCFVASKGRGLILQPNQVFKNSDSAVKKVHEYIMDLRHDYIAHAGSKYDLCPIAAYLIKNDIKSAPGKTAYKIRYKANMIYMNDFADEIDGFEKACDIMKEYLNEKNFKF